MPTTIVHIITNLSSGGAERMLYKLLAQSMCDGENNFEHVVISMVGKEFIGQEIESLGVTVHTLGLKRAVLPSPKVLLKLRKLIREYQPDIVLGWMYHGNLAAWFATKIASPKTPALLFNIRHSVADIAHEKPLSRLVIRLGAKVANSAAAIIYNSHTSARQHQRLGYPVSLEEILPNGFELKRYALSEAVREEYRKQFGFTSDDFVIALIGRFHPMKDHKTFIAAARIFSENNRNGQFLLVGRDIDTANAALGAQLEKSGVRDRFQLLGERNDIPQLLAAVDVLTSCSAWGEGFSNVIGEACASATPVVVTNVGDALEIVGELGKESEISDANSLANCWQELFEQGASQRAELGAKLRERVSERYSIEAITQDYSNLFKRVVSTPSQPKN